MQQCQTRERAAPQHEPTPLQWAAAHLATPTRSAGTKHGVYRDGQGPVLGSSSGRKATRHSGGRERGAHLSDPRSLNAGWPSLRPSLVGALAPGHWSGCRERREQGWPRKEGVPLRAMMIVLGENTQKGRITNFCFMFTDKRRQQL